MDNKISISEFKKLDLRVAQIINVEEIPNKDKLLKLSLDLGFEKRTIVAGIKPYYEIPDLLNKKIVIIANLEPATIGGIQSNGMLLAASNEKNVILLTIDKDINSGAEIS
jgi:methionyl-tRNA synthetase